MSRYLVTGCAGFIGSTLVDALLAEGSQVVGVDAFTDYYPRDRKEAAIATAASHPAFELVEHDLGDGAPARRGAGRSRRGLPPRRPAGRARELGRRDSSPTSTTTFSPRTSSPSAPPDAGCALVFASSSSVYGDALAYPTREDAAPAPVSPYGVTKLTCEHLLRAHARNFELDYVGLRYFTVYGPRQRPDMAFAQARRVAGWRTQPSRSTATARQSRDFTYVQDAVAATILAMRKGPPGAIYNVGGGSEATLRESVAILEELSGRTLDVRLRQGGGRRRPQDAGGHGADSRARSGGSRRSSFATGLASMLEAAGAIVPAGRDND